MIIDNQFNLAHLMQYKAKVYFVDKNISQREKMRIKAYINFLITYNNISIYFI